MEPIDSSDTEAIGWHLIARGGDMTARVHPQMQLGVLPSGDLSFEAPDAVVVLNPIGTALTLDVVSDDYELELEAGERLQTIRVGAQTHVRLDFLGHTLDIDNDFAVASPPGDALALYVVRKGEPRLPLGPVSAGAHQPDIRVPEASSVTPLKAVPVDYLQREHAVAAAEKRQAAGQRSNVTRVVLALVASVLVVTSLVVTALYVASRSVEESVGAGAVAAGDADPSGLPTGESEPPVGIPAGEPGGLESASGASQPGVESVPGVSEDMLARLSALLAAEPLPDKATIDFAVESLRSLMAAYPNDERIPAALAALNERLVQESRQAYDAGDGFRAGRLIEQATALGLAQASVAETLDYFASQPSGTGTGTVAAAGVAAAGVDQQAPVSEPEAVSDSEAEAMLSEAIAQEEASGSALAETATASEGALSESGAGEVADDAIGSASAEPQLDSLVESATGLALGALAVEVVIEDSGPGESTAPETDPVLAALGPVLPLTAEPTGVDSRVQLALDNYLADSAVVAETGTSANQLPDDFAADGSAAGADALPPDQPLSAEDFAAPPPPEPRFRPYSQLLALRQEPLVYPERADQGSGGSINVEFTVTETGRVIDVDVTGDAPEVFIREAARTIRTWRFAPVRENGERVPVRSALRITYRS